jgi:hypothetical protein
VELPDPNDIAILADHMQKRMEQSVRPETYDEFKELQYDTLARLIAFNRRRPGELQVMRFNFHMFFGIFAIFGRYVTNVSF